jgi:hypothetical protein
MWLLGLYSYGRVNRWLRYRLRLWSGLWRRLGRRLFYWSRFRNG